MNYFRLETSNFDIFIFYRENFNKYEFIFKIFFQQVKGLQDHANIFKFIAN